MTDYLRTLIRAARIHIPFMPRIHSTIGPTTIILRHPGEALRAAAIKNQREISGKHLV